MIPELRVREDLRRDLTTWVVEPLEHILHMLCPSIVTSPPECSPESIRERAIIACGALSGDTEEPHARAFLSVMTYFDERTSAVREVCPIHRWLWDGRIPIWRFLAGASPNELETWLASCPAGTQSASLGVVINSLVQHAASAKIRSGAY